MNVRGLLTALMVVSLCMMSIVPGVIAQDPDQSGTGGALVATKMLFQEGDTITPNYPAFDAEPQTKLGQARVTNYGVIITRERTDHSTWQSPAFLENVNVGASITFEMWIAYRARTSSEATEWWFDIKTESQTVFANSNGITKDMEGTTPVLLTVNIDYNGTAWSKGETLTVDIDFSAFDDVDIYFGAMNRLSGFSIQADSMGIVDVPKGSIKGVEVNYREGFAGTLYFYLTVDGERITEGFEKGTNDLGKLARWKTNMKEGGHSATIVICYQDNSHENKTGVTTDFTFNAKDDGDDGGGLPGFEVVPLLAAIGVAMVLIGKRR